MKTTIWLILSFFLCHSSLAQTNQARRGVLDIRNFNFSEAGYLPLKGEWELYMSNLIPSEKFRQSADTPVDYVHFPSTWDESSKSLKPGKGYATYRLRVLAKPGTYSLELPHFYSAYTLWINNELVASNGIVGTSEETTKPQWIPQTIEFNTASDTLDMVIHVSNFAHAKGGIRENILLGTPASLNLKRKIAVNSNFALASGLTLVSLLFVFVFMFVKPEVSSLHFAGLCFTWAVRSLFSNLYVVNFFFPDFPWEVCVKIEYICLYLMMIWAVLFLTSLFPEDMNKLFKYLFIACNVIFVLFTLLFNAWLYTQFLPVYLAFCLILLVYILFVLIRAVAHDRQGVWLIVSSIMLGVILFAYDISAYQGFAAFNPIITNFGYLVMFILMAICLAFQFGFLKRRPNRDMLTYDDLYGGGKK